MCAQFLDLYIQQFIKTIWAWDDDSLFEISKCHEPSVKKQKGAKVLPEGILS